MKKLIIVFNLLLFLTSVNAATYYVSTAANNGSNSNSGAIDSPWLTLSYACSQVTTSGNTIYVNAGTFIETSQSIVSVGVSIDGTGATSIIKAGFTSNTDPTHALIVLLSAEGTNGNQSISNIKIDGNAKTGSYAMYIRGRSNVKVHDCTIVDFSDWGITFNGRGDETEAAPTTFATGNEFYSNTITNCSTYATYGRGCLQIGGQDGMLIRDNPTMSQVGRTVGTNGYVIKYYRGGYLKNVKIYNNTITKAPYDGSTFDFAIELWHVVGGVDIYNNTIIGATDICYASKGSSTYSVDFHNNLVGNTTQQTQLENGFVFEDGCADIIVRNNYFRNLNNAIYLYKAPGGLVFENIYIYYNIIDGIGHTGSAQDGQGFINESGDNSGTINNLNIWNNVFYARYGNSAADGIQLQGNCAITNVSIRNNTIVGFPRAAIFSWMEIAGSTINTMSIENNCFFDNGHINTPYYSGITPTNVTTQNNITTDPLFVSTSDFTLQSGSPTINSGLNLGLTSDYSGYSIIGLPDIGAYEYRSTGVKKGISAGGGKMWGIGGVPYGL